MERTVQTPDGRTLAVLDTGDPAGRPVLVHMGSPNSRYLYEPNVVAAAPTVTLNVPLAAEVRPVAVAWRV